MEESIRDNGIRLSMAIEMGLAYSFGQMGPSMKACGDMIRQMEEVG